MSKSKNQPKPRQVPATRNVQPTLPAEIQKTADKSVNELLNESIEKDYDFSATIRQDSKELDVSYTPPKNAEGATTKREIDITYRDK